jgi:hypothetical protein
VCEAGDKKLAGTFIDLEGFTRSVEILSEKSYRQRSSSKAEAVQHFAGEVLQPLLMALGAHDTPMMPIRAQDWQDSATTAESVNHVFGSVKIPLERVYATYVANGEPGWCLQTYTDFVEDFGLLRDLKMLTIHRVFYALADMPEQLPRTHMTFEPFARSLVYLAQWAIEGDFHTHEKLLLLFHRMNATTGAVQMTHNTDLFNVVAEVREIQAPTAGPVDVMPTWDNVMKG